VQFQVVSEFFQFLANSYKKGLGRKLTNWATYYSRTVRTVKTEAFSFVPDFVFTILLE